MITDFVKSLRKLETPDSNDYLSTELEAITAPIRELPSIDGAIAPIFHFFESYPDADFGTPGPLMHLLAKHQGCYELELEASLRRKPAPHPVWMANRLLNSNLTEKERQRWIALLKMVLTHPGATESARSNAELFLEHQGELES